MVVQEATVLAVESGTVPKGDPLVAAKIAGTFAAKNTAGIIPYCHQVPLDGVHISFTLGQNFIQVDSEIKAIYKTGVEMEAMTAALVASLTIYDMLKMIDNTVSITDVRLLEKTGGKSDARLAPQLAIRAAVIVLSDSTSNGSRQDTAGKAIIDRLQDEGIEVSDYKVLADDFQHIQEQLVDYADLDKLDIVLTTGGTGIGSRDVTPDATKAVIDCELPGISEALRSYGRERHSHASLSRAIAGRRGRTLIVNLPGSARSVRESLEVVIPLIKHAVHVMAGESHDSLDNNKAPQ